MQERPRQPHLSYGRTYGSLHDHNESIRPSGLNQLDKRGDSQDERDSSSVGGVGSVVRRSLGAISILFLFGMGASLGNSRQHAGNDVGVPTGYPDVVFKVCAVSRAPVLFRYQVLADEGWYSTCKNDSVSRKLRIDECRAII